MFAENLFESPARVPPSITHSLLIEPEIAFRVVHDLPPRSAPYRPEEVAEALIACPAMERTHALTRASYDPADTGQSRDRSGGARRHQTTEPS